MNVETFEHQRGIRGISLPRHARQQQHFEISRQHHLTAIQDVSQPLQPRRRHRDRPYPRQQMPVLGPAEACGLASFNVRRRHGNPGKPGNFDLRAASLQHPDASVNGRVRKIVNEVGDLQESAPFEKCNACRINALWVATSPLW
ncbi:hypothetical protein [Bradyrhizobium roseum]|uniref:hypothetical protein n=1 Tax=Bradyrhizobium roseum TaxID=3056648 RepID=UPI00260A8E60|nr:hypothetical protein [Bradyrhizobium roseus]WKA30562.1 hypothetical protein QUH67_10515 [Bradyrhizobium roseus]